MSDPIDTLNKLFDTLKDASNRSESSTNKLIDQQMELITYIKTMPVEDLRTALKDHALKSDKDMSDCNGVIELRFSDMIDEIKKLSAKVTKMIIVVTVALTVMTAGYFIIRYSAEKGAPPAKWEERLKAIEQDQHEDIDKKLNDFMKEIRKEMRKDRVYHEELENQPDESSSVPLLEYQPDGVLTLIKNQENKKGSRRKIEITERNKIYIENINVGRYK